MVPQPASIVALKRIAIVASNRRGTLWSINNLSSRTRVARMAFPFFRITLMSMEVVTKKQHVLRVR
jgi:hypothetical protein